METFDWKIKVFNTKRIYYSYSEVRSYNPRGITLFSPARIAEIRI